MLFRNYFPQISQKDADKKQRKSAGEKITYDKNDISYKIRVAIFNVFDNLGLGLLESV